jgi:gliding motility-associated-like protein
MLIFNRWGQQIFHSTDLMTGWDGTLKGNPAQQGVYTYLVNYTTDLYPEQMNRVVGHVTLIR